jgi:subtilisin family serine protease
MSLIIFLLVINPINQELVFRPSFYINPDLESLTVHVENLKNLTESVITRGKEQSQSEVFKIRHENHQLQKYIAVLQKEFDKERTFLKERGLSFAITKLDAAKNYVMQQISSLNEAINNEDYDKISSLLEHATPSYPLTEPQPTTRLPEPRERIELVKETKQGIRSGPPVSEDTMPTVDARITPEIDSLAAQLNHDPRKIYEFVKNNIKYEPFYGSYKGSSGTLYEMCGDDMDQASLLIALLRASGIPCRYVRGVIRLTAEDAANWIGVLSVRKVMPILLLSGVPFTANAIGDSLISIDIEHVWVKIYVPIQHYMGIPTDDERGKAWLQLFPSIKRLNIDEGINLPQAMNFDFEQFFKQFIKNNPQAKPPLEFYRDKLIDYLNIHYPDKTYEDILMKQEIIEEEFSTLPLTANVITQYTTDEFAEIPAELRHMLKLKLKATYTNVEYLLYTVPMPTVFSRRFTLGYVAATAADQAIIDEYGGINQTPPYLIELKPVVRIGGSPVATGSAIGGSFLSSQMTARFTFQEPQYQMEIDRYVFRGLPVGIGLFQRPTDRLLSSPPAESLDTDGIAAINLYNTVVDYFSKVLKDQEEIDQSLQIRGSYYYTCGIVTSYMLAQGMYVPISEQWRGLQIDALQTVILPTPIEGDYGLEEAMLLSGMAASYWENRIFENRYDAEAISSAKAFRVAHDSSISIYKVNMTEITSFLAADSAQGGKSAGKSSSLPKTVPPVIVPVEEIKHEIIVKFSGRTEKGKIKEHLKTTIPGTEILKTSYITSAVLVKIPQHVSIESAIQMLQSSPSIAYAEPNYRYSIQSIAPNDPFFENQWGLRKSLINTAWDSIVGDSSLIISVLDTGIDTLHPDLENRIIPGYDFVNEDSFHFDDNGHGTQVAGIIGAETNNSIGIAGIDWEAKVLPIKVLNEIGIGDAFDAAQGIYYAIENNARILNLSFGSYNSSTFLAEAIDSAYAAGCVIVACAGNDKTSLPFYPAAYPNVMGISATKQNDFIAEFSNFGNYIDFAAPGVNIYTTQRGGGYGIVSGTSYSCGFISGVISLLFADEPSLTNADVYNILKERSDDLGTTGWDPFYGYGRLNAIRALIGPVGVMPVIAGYQILGGNQNGFAEAGETFDVKLTLYNAGDSTAYNVVGILHYDDPYVTVITDSGDFGDLGSKETAAVQYRVHFDASMPKGSVVKFTLNIAASGHGFTEEFTIKEGDLLSILALSDATKYEIANLIHQGYEVYVPQKPLDYMEWTDGENYFAYNPADYSNMWMMRGNIWGGQTVIGVDDWKLEYLRIFKEGCETVSIIPEILEPQESSVYLQGETFTMKVKFTVTMLCPKPDGGYEEITEEVIEDFVINTANLPPAMHTLYAEGHNAQGQPVRDEISIWVFTFNIDEAHVKKYFNPLKPDSARITYKVLPDEYANPYTEPRPISIKVEIKDNTGFTVYGERELANQEKERQVLFWDGRDNQGDTVNLEQGPFEAELSVYYRETGLRLLWGCARKTSLYPTEFNLITYDYENNEVPEEEEVVPGAFVHFDLDNDNASDNDLGSPEHPGGDYLEDGPIIDPNTGEEEDDLKLAQIKIKPFFETGRVELKRDNSNIRVWSSSIKGADKKILYDNDVKSWNLADPDQRAEFNAIKENLWVEGMAYNGKSRLFIWYYDAGGTRWCGDLVKYTFIAADCGDQPRTDDQLTHSILDEEGNIIEVSQRDAFKLSWNSLVHCEWSVTLERSDYYNCIAWSANISNKWVWGAFLPGNLEEWEDPQTGVIYMDIDHKYGNPPNNILEPSDFDTFYDAMDYEQTENLDEATIMLYKAQSAEETGNPDGITHAARKHTCDCGKNKWLMYESKCGGWEAIEHVANQLNGDEPNNPSRVNYGFPFRYYKPK